MEHRFPECPAGDHEQWAEREQLIIDAVQDGDYDVEFRTVVIRDDDHEVELSVFADALKVDGIRVNGTAATCQHVADLTGCCLLTPKIADQVWLQRDVTLEPNTQTINSTTAGMIKHHEAIEQGLDKLDVAEGLIDTIGKLWVLDEDIVRAQKLPNQAINYGWHFRPGTSWGGINGNVTASLIKDPETKQYVHMIQSRGWHHDIAHVDYSQVIRLVARDCLLDGQEADLADILKGDLASLVSHNGKLSFHRHPFVEQQYVGTTIIGRPEKPRPILDGIAAQSPKD